MLVYRNSSSHIYLSAAFEATCRSSIDDIDKSIDPEYHPEGVDPMEKGKWNENGKETRGDAVRHGEMSKEKPRSVELERKSTARSAETREGRKEAPVGIETPVCKAEALGLL